MGQFSLNIKDFADSFIDGAEQAVRGATIELWSSVIRMTPVDEGRARASWMATGKQPSVRVTTTTDKSGTKTIRDVTNVVMKLQDWSTFTLTSNLPYIEKLEFGLYNDGPKTVGGYSRQSPAGMVRVSVSRFNSLLEKEAKKRLPK